MIASGLIKNLDQVDKKKAEQHDEISSEVLNCSNTADHRQLNNSDAEKFYQDKEVYKNAPPISSNNTDSYIVRANISKSKIERKPIASLGVLASIIFGIS